MLFFFPTPYPDEILYGVLCRYHLRSGNNTGKQSNAELWNRILGKGLLFPADIETLAAQIPQSANLPAERLISKNTIFPLFKPFIPQNRSEIISDIMKNGENGRGNVFSVAGLAWTKVTTHKCLRYCEQCVRNDILIYGEAYWHRLHQLPWIYLCPEHETPIFETDILIYSLPHEYHPVVCTGINQNQSFKPDFAERLIAFSNDAYWLLQHGSELGYYEKTNEIYDTLLKTKGFRDWNGKTQNKKLGVAMADFYGKDFLDLLDAYDSGVCQWVVKLLQLKDKVNSPVYHLLLIRFLAGSAEAFFQDKHEMPSEYLPFGVPPYPCRNKICGWHLKDVIESISVKKANGEPRATFICPHCGFTYRRKRDTPKEKQYSGQIDVIDYGWKWHETLEELLRAKTSINKTAKILQCDTRTVVKIGISLGIFPPEQNPKHRPYIPKETNPDKISFTEQQNHYRQRWTALTAAYPGAARNELLLMDSKCYEWLRSNDKKWYEEHSPPSKKSRVDWSKRDDEYLKLITGVVDEIKISPGRPKQITILAVSKRTGIGGKLYERLSSGRLPKTQAFLNENLETLEQWRKRKILWAVQTLLEQGRLNLKNVKKIVGISALELKQLQEFIVERIEQARN
jgi:hypothetical protein